MGWIRSYTRGQSTSLAVPHSAGRAFNQDNKIPIQQCMMLTHTKLYRDCIVFPYLFIRQTTAEEMEGYGLKRG